MTKRVGSPSLPDRLPAVSDRWYALLRPLWLAMLALALLLVGAGTVFVMRDTSVHDLSFIKLGLASQVQLDGSVTIETRPRADGKPPDLRPGTRILSIDGKALPADARVWDVARRLERPEGATATLAVRTPDGRRLQRSFVADDANMIESGPAIMVPRQVRIGIRLVLSVATCLTLIACAALLFRRRARDPVALLISFSFLMFAGSADPPLALWMAVGLGDLFDAYSVIAWVLLVVALATFPDGRFVPRNLRWLLVIAPIAAIPLAIDETPMFVDVALGFLGPLALIGAQAAKYRRFKPGIERQQLKWAAFGFATGLLLLSIAVLLVMMLPESSPLMPLYGLAVLLFFDFGFLAMAIGLLVSLIRFRLWEADRVISKSAVSAAVTLGVGLLWTTSMDLVRTAVEFSLGEKNIFVSTAVGAVLAACIFAPTQALAQRWANSRLGNDRDKIAALAPKLVAWRGTERPEEIGQRALASLASTAHISAGAILVDTPRGRALLATRDVINPDALAEPGANPEGDGRFAMKFPLEDEDGPVGLLLLGPRSDYNRYNADEVDGLRAIIEPLSEAIRGAQRRAREVDSMQQTLTTVEERLKRLEGGGGQASPA